jgi:hypothetical protein
LASSAEGLSIFSQGSGAELSHGLLGHKVPFPITRTHAIEFDFGNKWTEAVGQSLYYSLQPGKKVGVVLILETMKDRKYWIRLKTTIEHFNLPIETWAVGKAAY